MHTQTRIMLDFSTSEDKTHSMPLVWISASFVAAKKEKTLCCEQEEGQTFSIHDFLTLRHLLLATLCHDKHSLLPFPNSVPP